MAEERISNWRRATDGANCPFCYNDRRELIDRRGKQWYCEVCSQSWEALSASDVQFLKVQRIEPT